MEKAGTSKSQRESARIIAKDSGETEESVRNKIRTGLKQVGVVHPQKSQTKTNSSKLEKTHGGHREGAGRKPKVELISHARAFAISAISHLGRIPKNDPERNIGFDMVINWIEKHREGFV